MVNKYSNSVALDGNPEPDLVHATGCKQPSLKKKAETPVILMVCL
jgi:hypothetical protein